MGYGDSLISIGTFCMILGGVNVYFKDTIDPQSLLICGVALFAIGIILSYTAMMATSKPKKNVGPLIELNKPGGKHGNKIEI